MKTERLKFRIFRNKYIRVVSQLLLSASLAGCSLLGLSQEEETPTHWSYSGLSGPAYWGTMDAKNTKCLNGVEQSPLNLEHRYVESKENLNGIRLNYKPTVFTVQNNGHTIQFNTKDSTNTITIENITYAMVQFHFHTPSEHQLNSKSFPLEVHFVHKNKEGALAVLGVMFEQNAENEALAEAFLKLPPEETTKDLTLNAPIDLMALIPKSVKSYRYSGSLTTPPCTEGVQWVVLRDTIQMSRDQIDAFKGIFGDNHRPVQNRNWRLFFTEAYLK